MLAIGITETRLSYTQKHPTSDLFGIGGLKHYWVEHCNELGIEPNSLQCIEQVWLYYRDNHTSEEEAMKAYKGAITKLDSTNKTLALARVIQSKL